jgi:hypothetical protein
VIAAPGTVSLKSRNSTRLYSGDVTVKFQIVSVVSLCGTVRVKRSRGAAAWMVDLFVRVSNVWLRARASTV